MTKNKILLGFTDQCVKERRCRLKQLGMCAIKCPQPLSCRNPLLYKPFYTRQEIMDNLNLVSILDKQHFSNLETAMVKARSNEHANHIENLCMFKDHIGIG